MSRFEPPRPTWIIGVGTLLLVVQGLAVATLGVQVALLPRSPMFASMGLCLLGLFALGLAGRMRRGDAVATCFGAAVAAVAFGSTLAWVWADAAVAPVSLLGGLALCTGAVATLAVPAAVPAAIRHSRAWHHQRSVWSQ
jgi:hypothetical protein